ncbi:nucleoside triphosphate pyrophosphatase [uncultured Corynebacterium sp.]|uniref:Maf family protein n=1 Tax=uncultured Corynebacterium sp. TaxID=159447 RepID=UPI0025DDD709|nr:Maf family nucleotide pyrophosphatase [uncultured Corynebacterium sp.]
MVLASSSPSRLMVLRSAGVEPVVAPPDVDEEPILRGLTAEGAGPAEIVTALAEAKAAAASAATAPSAPSDAVTASRRGAGSDEGAAVADPRTVTVVIACDSMLLMDGELSGKPHTVDETVRRWKTQRGREARLVTGHSITVIDPVSGTRSATEAISTVVRFGTPSDADIVAYAESGEPLGCAGAFTLEALGGWFIDGIDGDPSSVLGLSLPLIRRTLSEWGLDVSAFWNR